MTMTDILTIMVQNVDGIGQVSYFLSNGFEAQTAIVACQATIQALQKELIEAEIQRRVAEAQGENDAS